MAKFIYTLFSFKKLVSLILLNFLYITSSFGLGSLIAIRNNYFYEKPAFNTKRYYITAYRVFKVLDIKSNEEKTRQFFMVEANFIKKIILGKGFVFTDLNKTTEEKIKLFLKTPEKDADLINYYLVPKNALKLTGNFSQPKNFLFANLYEVEYELDLPEKVWAPDSGIAYRPNRSADWLASRSLDIIKDKNISKELRTSILQGIILVGYTPKQVLLSIDEPLEKVDLGSKQEWNFGYQKIIFDNEKVTKNVITEVLK